MMKKEKIINLTIFYLIAMIYPVISGLRNSSMSSVTNATFIISLFMLLIGLINGRRHRSLNSSVYRMQGSFLDQEKAVDISLNDSLEKKKDSFNYPLYLGIIMLITTIITYII